MYTAGRRLYIRCGEVVRRHPELCKSAWDMTLSVAELAIGWREQASVTSVEAMGWATLEVRHRWRMPRKVVGEAGWREAAAATGIYVGPVEVADISAVG